MIGLELIIAFTAGISFLIWLISSIGIVKFLEKQNVKINYWLIRIYLLEKRYD